MAESDGYSPQPVYLGCYTKGAGGEGAGIVVAVRDRRTGSLGLTGAVAATTAPSFLARHPTRPVLFAVNEVAEGTVSAWTITGAGGGLGGGGEAELGPLGTLATGGSFPCHLAVGRSGRHLFVANYGSGSAVAFSLDADGVPGPRPDLVTHSGRGPHPDRQEAPHAHMVLPEDDRLLTVDLGIDAVYAHRLDPVTGRLTPGERVVQAPPGTGPRRIAIDPEGFLHVVGELDASVTSYVDSTSGWREHSRVAASSSDGGLPSEIAISDDGRFLYVGNRGPDTISVFGLGDGRPSLVGEVSTGGSWPRHFALAGEFLYVANERSHSVVAFRVDATTGLPSPTGDVLSTPSPTCVLPW